MEEEEEEEQTGGGGRGGARARLMEPGSRVAVPPTVCCLRDGRALLIGAAVSSSPVQPMLVLAADRSSWSAEDSSLPYLLL